MITTGFDFHNVWLIWVILLEQELWIPAYNTKEKVYSNIKQLLWRGSRKWTISNIVIQTFIPENDIIKNITESNYKTFFKNTLKERKLFNYPPFSEILTLEYRHKSEIKSKDFMLKLKNRLDLENIDKKIDISLTPNTFKKYNQYYCKIIIKWPSIRNFIQNIKSEIMRNSWLSIIFE